jgi:hypothetical protein
VGNNLSGIFTATKGGFKMTPTEKAALKMCVEALKPFSMALKASEKTIVEDMPASDRVSHVVRCTTYWLSYRNYQSATEAITAAEAVLEGKQPCE